MADLTQLVRQIRRRVGDKPDQSRITIAVDDNDTTLTLPTGHVSTKFPRPGLAIEFDDGTGEEALIDSVDPGANTMEVLRGHNGTQAHPHEINCAVLAPPRYSFFDITEAVDHIIDLECWPNIWSARELSLAYQSTNDYYSPDVSDIEEVSYCYQLVSGGRYRLACAFLSPDVADAANFPRGALIIPETVDMSTIYVAYRARLTVSNLSPSQEALVRLGVVAHLLMIEEAQQVAPGAGQLDRRVSEGATQRAGLLLWQRFMDARSQERINLISEEQQGSIFVRGR